MRRGQVITLIAGASVLALIAGVVVGCGGGSTADDSKALGGKGWKAVEIAGVTDVSTAKGSASTAAFEAGTIAGSGGVNRYTGPYTTGPGNTIEIGNLASTQMAGDPALMAQEQAYFAALAKAAKYTVTDKALTLTDDGGKTMVKFEAVEPTSLTATEWQATAYNNGKGALQSLAADSTITAKFGEDGSLAGNASVNQYSTKYTVSGKDQMTIDAQIVTTKMAGPDNLMAQEAAYLAALPNVATYTVDGDELWLRDKDGAAMAVYSAK
jgi:heat shock protein HslJ